MHNFFGIFDSFFCKNKINYLSYFFRIFIMILYQVNDLSFLQVACVIKRVNKRQGHLFFFDIYAGWLANFVAVATIQQIVFYLESNTGQGSELLHGFYNLLIL